MDEDDLEGKTDIGESLTPSDKDIKTMIGQSINQFLEKEQYHEYLVETWINGITEAALNKLAKLCLPCKIILNTTIMQRNRSSLHFSSSCKWQSSTDRCIYVEWSSPK
nr:dynein light chain Tctex-type 1 isoform X2 [Halyomorpha halys]